MAGTRLGLGRQLPGVRACEEPAEQLRGCSRAGSSAPARSPSPAQLRHVQAGPAGGLPLSELEALLGLSSLLLPIEFPAPGPLLLPRWPPHVPFPKPAPSSGLSSAATSERPSLNAQPSAAHAPAVSAPPVPCGASRSCSTPAGMFHPACAAPSPPVSSGDVSSVGAETTVWCPLRPQDQHITGAQ